MIDLPIVTRRTRLRALTDTDCDVEAVHRILGDPTTTASVSFGQPTPAATAAWMQRRIGNQRQHGFSMWAIELLEVNDLVGLCGLFPHDNGEAELGYVIRADRWRQGLGAEAVTAVLAASARAGIRVFATIRSTNASSLALARSVGLTEVDHIDDTRGRLIVFRTLRVTIAGTR